MQRFPGKQGCFFFIGLCFWAGIFLCCPRSGSALTDKRPSLPLVLPEPDRWGVIRVPDGEQNMHALTLDQDLQQGLRQYLRQHGNPISAVVVVEVATGRILAMVQGREPTKWGSDVHSALYEGFPAASLFKLVPTIAVMNLARMAPSTRLGLTGGCARVHPRGFWMREVRPLRPYSMTLERAFADSCNSFYAKIALKYLGIGVLNQYAHQLGWGEQVPADFQLNPSPIAPPKAPYSSIHNVGRYAAGFGHVGLSPMHAAWISLLIARDGQPLPLTIFARRDPLAYIPTGFESQQIISALDSFNVRKMMQMTVRSGTAASAFRRPGMRHIKRQAGGKTGTLNCQNPDGLATWFAGLSPWEQPEIVVTALVVNGQRWVIKGTHLAAEAFRLWDKISRKKEVSARAPATGGRSSQS
ncbi:MAG: hypothetical protein H6618_04995 [Deltaproteobacteria bacterium]|nr:hypothetical protein [Deltaproteobacteria bacterium]